MRGVRGAEDATAGHGRVWCYLHGVLGVLVVEDEGLLDELVVPLQLVDLGFVVDDALLVLAQVLQLVLQGAVHLDGDASDLLHQRGESLERRRLTEGGGVIFAPPSCFGSRAR